jgi:hypothetical protein
LIVKDGFNPLDIIFGDVFLLVAWGIDDDLQTFKVGDRWFFDVDG